MNIYWIISLSVYASGFFYALYVFSKNREVRWWQGIGYSLLWPVVWLVMALG